MILQVSPGIRDEIAEGGCYFMSLLWWAVILENLSFSVDSINLLYRIFVEKKFMKADGTVLDPTSMYRYLGVRAKYLDKWEVPDYCCQQNQFEILRFGRGELKHFTAGNGFGVVTYDPMGISRTATEGKLLDKRIFERLS
jgi:hypothetical protein